MLYGNQPLFYLQHQASMQFDRLHYQARWRKLWSGLLGRPQRLLSLHAVQANNKIHARSHAGLQLVPIAKIRGSEGRCADFDADFRPLKQESKDRWMRIAVARDRDVVLPAVELVQINDSYFVRDGHHRISVTKMLGQVEIEAEVIVWHGGESPANASRQARRTARPLMKTQQPALVSHLLLNTGKLLMTIGAKLQARSPIDAATPALQGS